MRRFFFLLLALLLGAQAATAQVDVQYPPDVGFLLIETNTPDAVVMVDSLAVGVASEGPFQLPAGEVSVAIVEAAGTSWTPRRAARGAFIRSGELTTVSLNLPIRYRIDSMPPGAEIVLKTSGHNEMLGVTPLVVDRPETMDGLLVARLSGYSTVEQAPGDSTLNHQTLMLTPLGELANLDAATMWIPPDEPRRWIDYAAAGAALAAAGVAIYYKFEADAVDDRYRDPGSPVRGDPLLKAEAERLDTYSLAALGVMQAGLALLTIRFILR